MKSESKPVPKERVIIYMSKEQIDLAAGIAETYGWELPELHRMAHCIGLNNLADGASKILMNKKMAMKTEIAKMVNGLSPEDLASVKEFVEALEKHVE